MQCNMKYDILYAALTAWANERSAIGPYMRTVAELHMPILDLNNSNAFSDLHVMRRSVQSVLHGALLVLF